MNRRDLLSNATKTTLLAMIPALRSAAGAMAPDFPQGKIIPGRAIARPTPDQARWADLEMAMFVHFGNETYLNGRSPDFSVPASEVNPVDLNTDQWALTASRAGARYIVFVAKHGYGFCSWQTATTDFSLKSSPWENGKGDIMRDLSASCRKFGLGLGVYLSPTDKLFGAGTGGRCKTPAEQERYDRIYRQQLTELCSNYGPLVEIWFDGATVTPITDIIQKYQPHAAVFQGPARTIRWVGNEDGYAPYPCWNGIDRADMVQGTATALDGNPNGDEWLPNEVDVSIRRPDWFWTKTNANKVLTEAQLMSIYYCSVGRGCQLILNIPPNPTGLFDEKDVDAAAGLGAEVRRRFDRSLVQTSGHAMSLEVALKPAVRVDTVILQEDIMLGERVRAYQLEGRVDGSWIKIGEGTAIGHKRIQPVGPIVADAVRLSVTEAVSLPAIRTFALYNTGVAPPADWQAKPYVWALDLVGEWTGNHFTLDLSKHLPEARQYKVRFVPKSGKVLGLKDVVLVLGGAEQPTLLKRVPGRPDELIIDETGFGDTGTLSGTVEGAAEGSIIMGKL